MWPMEDVAFCLRNSLWLTQPIKSLESSVGRSVCWSWLGEKKHACHVPVCQWEEATPYFGAPTPFWSSRPHLEISRLGYTLLENAASNGKAFQNNSLISYWTVTEWIAVVKLFKGVLLCSFTKSWFCFGGVLEHALMLGGSKNALFFT